MGERNRGRRREERDRSRKWEHRERGRTREGAIVEGEDLGHPCPQLLIPTSLPSILLSIVL